MKLTTKIVFDALTDLDIFYMPYAKRSEDELWRAADQWFEDLQQMDVSDFKKCVSTARKNNEKMITSKHVLSEFAASNRIIEWKAPVSGPPASLGWVAGLLDGRRERDKDEPTSRSFSENLQKRMSISEREKYIGTNEYKEGFKIGFNQPKGA